MITLITGAPGTGKTHHLIQTVKLVDNYIILSPTWANIKRIQRDLPNAHIITVAAFNRSCIYTTRKYKHIFIDEFSMINVLQCRNILTYIDNHDPHIYIYGDQYQLISIDDGEPTYTSQDIKDIIKLSSKVNVEYALIKIRSLTNKLHIDKHIELDVIHRTENKELCDIYNDMRRNIYNKYIENYMTSHTYICENIFTLIYKCKYIIIAGNYGTLCDYYKRYLLGRYSVQEHMFTVNNKFNYIRVEKDCEYILTTTLNNVFTNNQIVSVNDVSYACNDRWVELRCNNELIKLTEPLPLQPYEFITVHRAQGCEYDNVIVDMYSMFEVGHLYTAITRAKKYVILVKCNNWKEIYIKQMQLMHDLMLCMNM